MLQKLLVSLRRVRRSTRVFAGAWACFVFFVALTAVLPTHPVLAACALAPLFLLISALTFKRVGFDAPTIAILVCGLSCYLMYLGYTSFAERNYDGPAQLDYIQYIADHGRRPPASHCLICHHPPLYYYLGAGVLLFFKRFSHLGSPPFGLQLLSLLLFTVFLVFAVKTIKRFTGERRLVRLATALVVFWPYSVQMSVRVHNDALAGTLMMVALYFIVRFYQQTTARDFWLATAFIALGLLAKSTSYTLVALLLCVAAFKPANRAVRLRVLARSGAALVIFGGAVVLAGVGRGAPPPTDDGGICRKFLGNACDIGRHQWVQNEPYNYFYVDPRSFLKEPYLIAEKDGSGRELFWNDLAKTSLFGTNNRIPDRETAYELNRGVAGVMNGLLAAMTTYLCVGIVFVSKATVRKYGVILLAIGSFVAFMIAFRVMIPAPHHTDFRHVFVILVPMVLLYVTVVGQARRRGLALEWVGRALALAFLALSIFYFLPKRELVMRFAQKTIPAQLAAYSKPVPEGTPWDKDSNLAFEENHTIELAVAPKKKVAEIDVTLDSNDRYELTLFGDGPPRKVLIGPPGRKVSGLARYVQKVDPPVSGVNKITLRAVSGDQAYAMGHLLLR